MMIKSTKVGLSYCVLVCLVWRSEYLECYTYLDIKCITIINVILMVIITVIEHQVTFSGRVERCVSSRDCSCVYTTGGLIHILSCGVCFLQSNSGQCQPNRAQISPKLGVQDTGSFVITKTLEAIARVLWPHYDRAGWKYRTKKVTVCPSVAPCFRPLEWWF